MAKSVERMSPPLLVHWIRTHVFEACCKKVALVDSLPIISVSLSRVSAHGVAGFVSHWEAQYSLHKGALSQVFTRHDMTLDVARR